MSCLIRPIAALLVALLTLPFAANAQQQQPPLPAPLPDPLPAPAPTQTPPPAPPPLNADAANDPATTDGAEGLLRLQVLLDRAHFSPGQIDGQTGSNQQRALRGYQSAKGLPVTGQPDPATWQALNTDTKPIIADYTLTQQDVAGPYVQVPHGISKQANLKSLGYSSLIEALGERFHVWPTTLQQLNPSVDFAHAEAGTKIKVTNVADIARLPKAAKVVVDKSDSTLSLLDAQDKVMAQFPVTSGSEHDPLPIGEWKIVGINRNPIYYFSPKLFWDASKQAKPATIAPGPNNPVGLVWIALSKEHYGIHGTPEPRTVGKTQSHGCVRLTNWNALIVANSVNSTVPVIFQE